jgi:hypothetical protein
VADQIPMERWTDEQFDEASQDLAERVLELREAEAEKAAFGKAMNERIKDIRLAIDDVARELRDQKAARGTPVAGQDDFAERVSRRLKKEIASGEGPAIEVLRPKKGSGIDMVTISSGGHSTTLDAR